LANPTLYFSPRIERRKLPVRFIGGFPDVARSPFGRLPTISALANWIKVVIISSRVARAPSSIDLPAFLVA
jgi:hypothetical protein